MSDLTDHLVELRIRASKCVSNEAALVLHAEVGRAVADVLIAAEYQAHKPFWEPSHKDLLAALARLNNAFYKYADWSSEG